MGTSASYIVSWDRVFDNTIHIEDELIKGGFDYLVINKSSLNSDSPKWQLANDTRYYGHFLDALTHFVEKTDKEIFIFNSGDSRWQDMAGYTARIESIMESDSWIGVLSPDQTNDPFTGAGAFIQDSSVHPGLYLCTLTNGILVAIRRDVAELTLQYMEWALDNGIDFYYMTSGWGLDYVYCAISYLLDKKVYKDGTVMMSHPDGSGYNYTVATVEANSVMDSFVEFWSTKHSGSDKIKELFSVFMRKVHEKDNYKVLLKEVYLNGRQPARI